MVQDSAVPLLNFPSGLLDALRCPVCGHRLTAGERQLRCPEGHSFDQARQGYVHLGTGRRLPDGDSPEMVEARAAIQSAGLFAPLTTTLGEAAAARPAPARQATARPGMVADLGAGTGHYLAAVLDALPGAQGLAMDVSKAALRRAARAHPRAGAVLADTWGTLPLAGASVDLLLNVFAPRNGAEMRRVLRPGGRLLVVTPTADHLGELREAVGLLDVHPDKQERLADSLPGFQRTGDRELSWRLRLDRAQARALIGMGPSARHLDPATLAGRLERLAEPIAVTGAVRLATFS
jgi:23S rRNA (guanine745-N1)-methyltransferase